MSSITGYNPATVPTLASGTYRHVALSISGTVHTLYLDGSMVAQNLSGGNVFASYTSAIQNLYIGCAGDLSYGLTGSIDDFKIWNRVLPASDISAIYYSQLVPPAPFTDLTTIPGLTFWFDANVASTFDFANQVWTDRSGNGNKLNLTASNTLKIDLTTVPSTTKPAIRVPYLANKWVYKTSASSNILFQPNFTLFYVFYNTTNPGPEGNIIFYGQNFNIYLIQNSAGSYQITSNTGGTATTLTNLVSNSLNILNLSIDTNNNVRINVNGTNIASYTSNYYSTAATTYQIQGGGSQSSNTSTLYISESAYYGSVLNAYQYQQVEGYLAWKWGLQTSLPIYHPYYPSTPLATTTNFSLGSQYALTTFGAGPANNIVTYTYTNGGAGVAGTYVFTVSSIYTITNTSFANTFTNMFISNGSFNQVTYGSTIWTSGPTSNVNDYTSGTGVYKGTTSTTYNGATTVLGEWIQVKLPQSIVLLQYNIGSVQDTSNTTGGPSNWILLGSNNGSTWFSVDNKLTANYTFNSWGGSSTNYIQINPVTNNSTSYSYYRLVINKTGGRVFTFISNFNVIGTTIFTQPVSFFKLASNTTDTGSNPGSYITATPSYTTYSGISAIISSNFNGAGSKITINPLLSVSTGFSISFWTLTNATANVNFLLRNSSNLILSTVEFNNPAVSYINYNTSWFPSTNYLAYSSIPGSLNIWYHYVLCITNTFTILYVNPISSFSSTPLISTKTGSTTSFSFSASGNYMQFDRATGGQALRNVGFYNYLLSPTQVNTIWSSGLSAN